MREHIRRCTECGSTQHLERRTVDYPESGLDNVQLMNVPVWVCENGHEELTVPAVDRLHDLLAQMILRKPAALVGSEVRFLRRRLAQQSKEFAQDLGITPVQLSRLEHGSRRMHRRTDLLIRLFVAASMAARRGEPFPADLVPLVDRLEGWDIGSHRLRHVDAAPPEREWEPASV